MSLESDPKYPLAYCTNVHPGTCFYEMFENLCNYVPRVQELRSHRGPMGVGLWFSSRSIVEARQPENLKCLREFLDENSLVVFTANAFPQGNFHQSVVKYDVYEPDWSTAARLEYTLAVLLLMDEITPDGCEVSVSTLPLGWPKRDLDDSFFQKCSRNLLALCRILETLERTRGRLAYLCLEPEPGCLLDSSDDVVQFFNQWLCTNQSQTERVHRYLRVCHDICHSAVMFEPQVAAIEKFREAGIEIGKVQVSSAIEANFSDRNAMDQRQLLSALQRFHEPRYLHQTNVQYATGETRLFDDLPLAISGVPNLAASCWRVHFHVPVHIKELGVLRTTNDEISQFFRGLNGRLDPKHFEVETYAWNVLPASHAPNDLAAGIAAELDWVNEIRRTEQPAKTG